MATGQPPFPQHQLASLVDAILNRAPRRAKTLNPEVPGGLERVIAHALRKQRDRRVQSAADLASALEAAVERREASATGRRGPAASGQSRVWSAIADCRGGVGVLRRVSPGAPP